MTSFLVTHALANLYLLIVTLLSVRWKCSHFPVNIQYCGILHCTEQINSTSAYYSFLPISDLNLSLLCWLLQNDKLRWGISGDDQRWPKLNFAPSACLSEVIPHIISDCSPDATGYLFLQACLPDLNVTCVVLKKKRPCGVLRPLQTAAMSSSQHPVCGSATLRFWKTIWSPGSVLTALWRRVKLVVHQLTVSSTW